MQRSTDDDATRQPSSLVDSEHTHSQQRAQVFSMDGGDTSHDCCGDDVVLMPQGNTDAAVRCSRAAPILQIVEPDWSRRAHAELAGAQAMFVGDGKRGGCQRLAWLHISGDFLRMAIACAHREGPTR